MKITIVAGARPNFIKIAPIIKAIENRRKGGALISYRLVHTGQHYDKNLSDTFFNELQIPKPDANLEVKSSSQASQTAAIMIAFEKEIEAHRPDLVLVVGDVNSTMACAIVAKKMCVKVAHIEAGIRSGDWTMPEEINRIVTDSITDYFFTTSSSASQNLLRAGAIADHVHFVGNVMIDTLLEHKNRFSKPVFFDQNELSSKSYIILTLHRPSNVDHRPTLMGLLNGIDELSEGRTVVFPIHPRTKSILETQDYRFKNILFVEPQGYLNFMFLVTHSFAVITDSGGLSEETTVLGVPCFTMRETTERPETELIGTNILVGNNLEKLSNAFKKLVKSGMQKWKVPDLWDGHASERIVDLLLQK